MENDRANDCEVEIDYEYNDSDADREQLKRDFDALQINTALQMLALAVDGHDV